MVNLKYETIDSIAKTIRLRNLRNVIIETGAENAFYPEENRFVLSKEDAKDAYNLVEGCWWLESVDFTNFDFSEIKSMCGWFNGCFNLKEIIFPKNVVCKNLWNLRSCFSRNVIKEIDFSSWIFERPIKLDGFVVKCPLLKTIKLPKMKVEEATRVISTCESLTTIEAPIELTKNATIKNLVLNCQSLKVIDVSNAKLDSTKSNKEVLMSDNNLYNIAEDCVILV